MKLEAGISGYFSVVLKISDKMPLSREDFIYITDRIGSCVVVWMNPRDMRDLYCWDVNVTGWSFCDRISGGETTTVFDNWVIERSPKVPQGKIIFQGERHLGLILKVANA